LLDQENQQFALVARSFGAQSWAVKVVIDFVEGKASSCLLAGLKMQEEMMSDEEEVITSCNANSRNSRTDRAG
jgi:hypothetical protein